MPKNFIVALSLFFSCVLLLVSCNDKIKSNIQKSDLAGVISIDGSSTVYPITEAVAEEFRLIASNVKVLVGISGTGGGFKKLSRGETNITDASRKIKPKEAELCKLNGIEYIELPIAIDGLAVIVHPDNYWVNKLTVEELKKIWEPNAQEKIRYWNQIRPEWPKEEIHLFGPGTASGTYDCFSEIICGLEVGTRGDYTASEDDNMLVQGIARDKNALGFFGLAYYKENVNKLKLVAIDNGDGPILPSFQTIKNGRYSFLSRQIYIYVTKKTCDKKEVQAFIKFYLAEAADLATELGYIPLSDELYKNTLTDFTNFCSKATK